MDKELNFILPIYITVYFLFAFVIKSLLVAQRIKKSPLVLPDDDSAFGLIGKYFKTTMVLLFIYVFSYSFFPNLRIHFKPFLSAEYQVIQYIGYTILAIAFIWTVIAQNHMKQSWRIGIDRDIKTELITNGIFKLSRNPIFLGMIMCLIGLLLICQNAFTLIFLLVSYILIQVQVRLEEAHLEQNHTENYLNYKQKVRRYL
jgi:protein-S-isoprenylcysteine O-methyltransferase Ste14